MAQVNPMWHTFAPAITERQSLSSVQIITLHQLMYGHWDVYFAELLVGAPLFPGESSVDQLVEIIKVLLPRGTMCNECRTVYCCYVCSCLHEGE